METKITHGKLKGLMAEKGYSIRRLSDETGISLSTLSNKLNGATEFKTSEILMISNVLQIRDVMKYFF